MIHHKRRDNIVIALLIGVIVLIFVSFIPMVFRSGLYDSVHRGIIVIMLLLSILSAPKSGFLSCRFIVSFIGLICLIGFMFLVFMAGHLHYNLGDVTQLVIILICIIIGYSLHITDRQIVLLCMVYAIASIIVGYFALVSYTGTFSFSGDRNLIDGKNQIGGLVAVAGAISFYLMITQPGKKIYTVLTVLIFVVSALIRARAAFVAFVLVGVLMAIKKYPFYKVLLGVILLTIVYILFNSQINNFVFDSLAGRGSLNVDDLTTGRVERNRLGLQYLSENFWTGELHGSANIPWIHNYLLLRLVRYGILGCSFIMVYFLFLAKLLHKYIIVRKLELNRIGFFLPIIPFAISLVEPSYPFGPGTVQFFVYLLFGYSLRCDSL